MTTFIGISKRRPLNGENFQKTVTADKQHVVEVLKNAGTSADLVALQEAFDDLGQVAGQGLSVYNSLEIAKLERWDRCFDADNLAVASARVVLELDRLMEQQGWKFRSGREYFAANGIDLNKLQAAQIDLARNEKGMSKGGRRALTAGIIAGMLAGPVLAPVATAGMAPFLSSFNLAQFAVQQALTLGPMYAVYGAATASGPHEPPLYVEAEFAKETPEAPPDK